MTQMNRAALLAALMAGSAAAGWLPAIDTITNRSVSDVTCRGNARAVVEDAFGNIHVVWRGASPDTQRVWYSRLGIEANTWTTDTVISGSGPAVTDPAIAADSSGNILVVWTSGAHLRARRRLGASGQWEGIDSAAGSSGDSSVSVAYDRLGIAHIVWLRDFGTTQAIFHTRCDTAIGPVAETVAGTTPNLGRPSIAAAPNGNLMVVWGRLTTRNEVIARRRAGGTWLEPEIVSGPSDSRQPSVASTPDSSFHAVWLTGAPSSSVVTYSKRSAGGWEEIESLTVQGGRNTCVSVAGDRSGCVWAAWAGPNANNRYRTLCRRKPKGSGWLPADTLSLGNNEKTRVSAAAQVGTAQVAWCEQLLVPPQPWHVRLRRYERMHDVSAAAIEEPSEQVDSGSVVFPRAVIANYGKSVEMDVAARMRIGRATSERRIAYLTPRGRESVQFDSWTAESLGWHVVSCSTSVADDEETANDSLATRFFVRLQDVIAESIVSPRGEIDSLSIVPKFRVRNRGNVRDSCWCRCWLDSGTTHVYEDSARTIVDSAGTVIVSMRPWQTRPGSFRIRFTIDSGDMHPENDTVSGEFTVVRRDVGVARIIWPIDRVDSAVTGTPTAVVANSGSRTESFVVACRIGSLYADTALVSGLSAGDTAQVAFAEWIPLTRGSHPVACSTMLALDRNAGNDRCSDSVFVVVRDAACTDIVRPSGVVSRGLVQPEAGFANHGTDSAGMWCWFEVTCGNERDYLDSMWLEIPPGAESSAVFRNWLAHTGRYSGRAWSALPDDMHPENDASACNFLVPQIDAALRGIVEPAERIAARAVVPKVRVANVGETVADIRVHCLALTGDSSVAYSGTAMAPALPETTEAMVSLPVWNALPGRYQFVAWTELPDDSNPENDSATIAVAVESVPFGRWTEMAPIPAGPRRVPVRGGSCLTSNSAGILALKGGNTGEWYRFSPEADSWQTLAVVPAETSGRRAGRGAALAAAGDSIFLLRGMGTLGFLAYSSGSDSWLTVPSLPGFTRGIRYGSGLAFVPARDTGKVFCLKGGGARDFLVYWCRQRQWHARRSVPVGETGRGVRRGSALVALGSRVFCLLGTTNELFEYLPRGDSWVRRERLPLVNRRGYLKRSRVGACLAADGSRFIYALKGGGSNELWRYDAIADRWFQLDDVPPGKHRCRVKAGAGIAVFNGSIWVTKGGGCSEFWRYEPEALPTATAPTTASPPDRRNVGRPARLGAGRKPTEAKPRVRVWDVTGRVVGTVDADCSGRLPVVSGIFFLEVSAEHGTEVRKVIVVR